MAQTLPETPLSTLSGTILRKAGDGRSYLTLSAGPGEDHLSRLDIPRTAPTETPGPIGHGLTQRNLDSGEIWWTTDVTPHVRLFGLDTCNAVAGADGAVPDDQFEWLRGHLERAKSENTLVLVLTHHNSSTLENRAQRPGSDKKLHCAEEFVDLLLEYPVVIGWLNGHTHQNQILRTAEPAAVSGRSPPRPASTSPNNKSSKSSTIGMERSRCSRQCSITRRRSPPAPRAVTSTSRHRAASSRPTIGRARVALPALIACAAGQALLVIGDPVPRVDWAFALRALASGLLIIVLIWLLVGTAATAMNVDARWSIPSIRLLSAVTGVVVVGALAGVLSPMLPILVAAIGLPILSALAIQRWTPLLRTVTFSPLRTLLGFVLVAVLFGVDWVSALLLGFFVGGPVAAGLTWTVFGLSTAVLTTYWAALYRRVTILSKPFARTV